MNNDLSGMLCLGSIFLVPVVTFVFGLLIGGNKLPFRVRIEKNIRRQFGVDDDSPTYGK